MAVGIALIGKNVRCPHCKSVVKAHDPKASPPVADEVLTPETDEELPKFQQPTESTESIFSEHSSGDDFFADEPLKPVVPQTENIRGNYSLDDTENQQLKLPPNTEQTTEFVANEEPELAIEPTNPFEDFSDSVANEQPTEAPKPISAPAPAIVEQAAPEQHFPAQPQTFDLFGQPELAAPRIEALDEPPSDDVEEEEAGSNYQAHTPKTTKAKPEKTIAGSGGSSAFTWILLAYGLLMTGAAGFFGYSYFLTDSTPHPFENIPDVYGQYQKADPKQTSLDWLPLDRRPVAELSVPEKLQVTLGNELTVGDLKIVPQKIVRDKLVCVTETKKNRNERPVPPETIILHLNIQNLSKDLAFHPDDPAFNRAKKDSQPTPLTSLWHEKRSFCGTFDWPHAPSVLNEYAVGYESRKDPLKPGEEATYYVHVAPKESVLNYLKPKPKDTQLIWKVQLRKGKLTYQDEGNQDRSIWATTVIGVKFQLSDIQ